MNVVSMLLHQTVSTPNPGSKSDEFTVNQIEGQSKLSFFQEFLTTKVELEAEWKLPQKTESGQHLLADLKLFVTEKLGEEVFISVENVHDTEEAIANLSDDELKELYAFLFGHVELVDEQDQEKVTRDVIGTIQDLYHGQYNIDGSSLSKSISHFQNNKHVHDVRRDQMVINRQFDEIMVQVELLLTNITDEQEVIKISPRILELLGEWTTLANRNSSQFNQSYPKSTESTSDPKVQAIWKELLSNFQKRNELATNQHYQTNSKVTTKDISKWLHNSLFSQFGVDESSQLQPINISNQPVSKLEQYVIYLNQSEPSQPIDKQLIEQFQQVMRTSRFLTLNNGANQLSIALRPNNLGEMMVRFTEINGEMTLKIIVSSQSTKQILESNIHQLKHMFSPHQVVIEEREVIVDHVNGQPEEQAFAGEEDQSQESNQEESRNHDKDYEIEFHDLLMNAKV